MQSGRVSVCFLLGRNMLQFAPHCPENILVILCLSALLNSPQNPHVRCVVLSLSSQSTQVGPHGQDWSWDLYRGSLTIPCGTLLWVTQPSILYPPHLWVLGGHPWAQCSGCAHPGGIWDPQPPNPHPPWGAEPDKALQGDGAVSSQVG